MCRKGKESCKTDDDRGLSILLAFELRMLSLEQIFHLCCILHMMKFSRIFATEFIHNFAFSSSSVDVYVRFAALFALFIYQIDAENII